MTWIKFAYTYHYMLFENNFICLVFEIELKNQFKIYSAINRSCHFPLHIYTCIYFLFLITKIIWLRKVKIIPDTTYVIPFMSQVHFSSHSIFTGRYY